MTFERMANNCLVFKSDSGKSDICCSAVEFDETVWRMVYRANLIKESNCKCWENQMPFFFWCDGCKRIWTIST